MSYSFIFIILNLSEFGRIICFPDLFYPVRLIGSQSTEHTKRAKHKVVASLATDKIKIDALNSFIGSLMLRQSELNGSSWKAEFSHTIATNIDHSSALLNGVNDH